MIDARLSVNVLPSLYFQMFHLAMYMNNNHHLCISFKCTIMLAILYSCAPEFIMSIEGIFATDAAA